MANRHGYWKIWGYAATCSECNYCGENLRENYCMNCGTKMDMEPRWAAPDFSNFPSLVSITCKACGNTKIISEDNPYLHYCSNCGCRMDGE